MDAIIDSAFESLEYQIKNEGLKYIVLVGDLTTNGEYEGHVALAERLREFREKTGCEIYLTNGNHDINNSGASTFVNNIREQGRITTPAEFAEIYHDFGFDQAYHQYKETFGDGTQGSLSYSISLPEGYRLIIADGGKYSSDATAKGLDEHEAAGAFPTKQLEWILSEAEDAKKKDEIPLLFTHWNMSEMNYFHGELLQGFVIDDGYMLQEILADAGIHYSFSGHQHVSDVDITYSDSGEAMYSIITPTLTQYPFSYRTTTFTPDEKGNLDVTYDMMSVDEHSAVKSVNGSSTYPAPYRTTGFYKQYLGRTGTSDFLWKIVKKMLDNYMGKIRAAGSIVDFVEEEFNIDLEDTLNGLINGGVRFGDLLEVSGKNLMSFVRDLDSQLMQSVIYPKSDTYALIKNALDDVCNYQISDVPCTKYISTYGFGDTEKGGTLGDLLAEALVYLYYGNEDCTGDEFILDILRQSESPEFTDLIFRIAVEKIAIPVVVDGILAKTELHLDALFVNTDVSAAKYVQLVFAVIAAVADGYTATRSSEEKLLATLNKLGPELFDVNIKKLAETVLATGLVPYGTTIEEALYGVLDHFFPAENKLATAYQLNVLLDGIINDPDRDWDVTYTYAGPVEITPTEEDMQLPVRLTVSYGKDAAEAFTVTWFTKYSVKGTDIEFTSDYGCKTEKTTEETTITGYGFDFGTFGILPWTRNAVKHTVTVTGFTPGDTIKFRVGDEEKGFFSDECSVKTSAGNNDEFSFITIANSQAIVPESGNELRDTLKEAEKYAPDAAFILQAGDLTRETADDDRWSYVLSPSAEYLRKLPLMAAPATEETDGFVKYLSYEYEEQFTDAGVFYSFDYNNAHFIVLNQNNVSKAGTLSGEQIRWLRADLNEAADKDWTILTVNAKLYGAENTDTALRNQIISFMDEYGIDMLIQGGSHYYTRSELIVGTGIDSNPKTERISVNGKIYTVYCDNPGLIDLNPGTSGMYYVNESGSDGTTAVSDGREGNYYSVVNIRDNILTVDSYACYGGYSTLIDSFGLKKQINHVVMGDADSDSKVTVSDARTALRIAIGLEKNTTELQYYVCDVDDIEGVTVTDARAILRAAIGLEKINPAKKTVTAVELRQYADRAIK